MTQQQSTRTIKIDFELSLEQCELEIAKIFDTFQHEQTLLDIASQYVLANEDMIRGKTPKGKTSTKKATPKATPTPTPKDVPTDDKIKGTTKAWWGNEWRFFANGKQAIESLKERIVADGHKLDDEVRTKDQYGTSVSIISLAWTRNQGGIQFLIPDNEIE